MPTTTSFHSWYQTSVDDLPGTCLDQQYGQKPYESLLQNENQCCDAEGYQLSCYSAAAFPKSALLLAGAKTAES